jgi:hypothetical protein
VIIVKKGGFSEWREYICCPTIVESNIRKLQQALQNRGYYEGGAVNVKLTRFRM